MGFGACAGYCAAICAVLTVGGCVAGCFFSVGIGTGPAAVAAGGSGLSSAGLVAIASAN